MSKPKLPNKLRIVTLWIVIPIVLVILGISLSAVKIYRDEVSFLTLTYGSPRTQLTVWKDSELLAGEKIVGEFTSQDDYLGIVAVRFDNLFRINDDYVIFRLKEKGQNKWYYQNRYKVDQFQPGQLFPFGFPIIKDSAGKKYVFEVESVNGRPGNAIRVDPTDPVFFSRHKFPVEVILNTADGQDGFDEFSSKKLTSIKTEDAIRFVTKKLTSIKTEDAIRFVSKKIINLFINLHLSFFLVFYFIPFITYLYWLLVYQKIRRKIFLLVFFPVIFILLDLLLVLPLNDFIYIEASFYWILFIYYYKLKSNIVFGLSALLLLGCPLFLYLHKPLLAEKVGVWSFIILSIAVLKVISGNKIPRYEKMSLNNLFSEITKEVKSFRTYLSSMLYSRISTR